MAKTVEVAEKCSVAVAMTRQKIGGSLVVDGSAARNFHGRPGGPLGPARKLGAWHIVRLAN